MPPKKNNQRQRPRRAYQQKNNGLMQPPALPGNLRGRHTFRFKQTETASSIVNLYTDDLAFMMGVGTASNVMKTLWESLLIHKISIWTPSRQISGTLQDPRETSITWLGEYAPRSEIFSTINVQAGVAYVHSNPPRNSGSGKWQKVGQGATAQPLVRLVVPDQSIVDITVSYIFDDDTTVTPISVPGYTGLAIGTLYYAAADSYYGTKVLTPMGLTPPA
jgi:hypothetical protein